MPTEVIAWVFPGVLFVLTVLIGVIFKFNREEVKELKDTNEEQNKRFLTLESSIIKSQNDIREETRIMIEKSQTRAEKDLDLFRADVREQMTQMRELIYKMESNIIMQMKMLMTANKE